MQPRNGYLPKARRFVKVLDGRQQPIRGLWTRHDRFYARLAAEDSQGKVRVRWVPLEGAQTPAEARDRLRELQVKREKSALVVTPAAPKFSDYAQTYIERLAQSGKTAKTISTEKGYLTFWRSELGAIRLDRLRPHQINAGLLKLRAEGLMPRTCNLSLTVLRNVLRAAKVDGYLTALPVDGLQRFRVEQRPRQLVDTAQIEALCRLAPEATRNATEFIDYLRFLQFTGCREREALQVRWTDVQQGGHQVVIGAAGGTKNREARVVDLSPAAEQHLRDMRTRRAPDSQWLFPSPQRGDADRPARTFRESLRMVRTAAGLPRFGFHDLRHYFISHSVMSGIDFMTIAKWVGHKDGGVLIGRVYGHLADDHRRRMAAKLSFDRKTD